MTTPLVSIIITCYNYGRFVKDAIDSALNQTYKSVELVIVNDGSTDESDSVIKQYLHNSNVIYINQSNTGVAIARNNGIEKSSGSILLCLDADDAISSDYIENIVKNFTDYKTIVSTHVFSTDESLNSIISVWRPIPSTYQDLLQNNQIAQSSGFSRKLFDEVGGYDPGLTRMGYEDWDLWIRMYKAGAKATVINSANSAVPYFKYRKHGNSMLSNSEKIHDKIVDYMNKKYIKQNFYIDPTYKTNTVKYFDDTELRDEWQKEVYEYAEAITVKYNYKTIIDFGCGSGFKLLKHFKDYDTIGIDLPATVQVLNKRYPDRIWQDNMDSIDCDLFIASDVIEHMEDPNIMLDFIEKCNPKAIIISTPDRNQHLIVVENGPPQNLHHIREWSFIEFRAYIESRFDIVSHSISNRQQATQMIHAKLKSL